jgi:hypothetical protein
VVENAAGSGYLVVGDTSDSLNQGVTDHYMMNVDNVGVVIWCKMWGGTTFDKTFNVILSSLHGGYLLVGGTSDSTGQGSYDGLALKVTSAGVLEWIKTYGFAGSHFEQCWDVVERTQSGSGYMLGCFTNGLGAGNRDILFLELNSAGVPQSTSTLGSTL